MLCYRKASYAMFSRKKCSAAWQAAPGQGLTVATMLPGRQMADNWLDFMLSQRNLLHRWFPKKPFVKNGADWMPSIFVWRSSWAGMFYPTGCTQWPLRGSHVSNYMSCYSTRLPLAAKRISMKRKHAVDLLTEKSRHCGSNAKSGCCITHANVLDIKGFLHAFQGEEEDAPLAVDAYIDYCAGDAQVDITDIWSYTWVAWLRHYMVEKMLWGAERGSSSFTILASFHWPVLCCWVCFVCVGFVCLFCRFCWWKLPVSLSFANS